MNTAPLIARLAAQCPGFNFIGGAVDLNESALQATNYPAAFVLPRGDSAEPNALYGAHDQRITRAWGIVITLKAMRTTAQDQSPELDDLRRQVRAALAGWQIDADTTPLNFTAGQLVSLEAGVLLWLDDFSDTTYHRTLA